VSVDARGERPCAPPCSVRGIAPGTITLRCFAAPNAHDCFEHLYGRRLSRSYRAPKNRSGSKLVFMPGTHHQHAAAS